MPEHCYSDLFSLESHVFTRAILHSLPYQKNRSRENRAEKERSSWFAIALVQPNLKQIKLWIEIITNFIVIFTQRTLNNYLLSTRTTTQGHLLAIWPHCPLFLALIVPCRALQLLPCFASPPFDDPPCFEFFLCEIYASRLVF